MLSVLCLTMAKGGAAFLQNETVRSAAVISVANTIPLVYGRLAKLVGEPPKSLARLAMIHQKCQATKTEDKYTSPPGLQEERRSSICNSCAGCARQQRARI